LNHDIRGLKNQCAVKSRESPVGEINKPTPELTLHPEPPGGLVEETVTLHEIRRLWKKGLVCCT
jgi:hypothetical protein